MNKSIVFRVCRALTLGLGLAVGVVAHAQSVSQAQLLQGLNVYIDQLNKQIAAQDQAKRDIVSATQQAPKLRPVLVAQMQKMVADLKSFIQSDLPFQRDVRLGSIAQLEELMVNADANDADRFRNILDIYNIELEYGNSYEAYQEVVTVSGNEIEVDMLRIGRLGLYYITQDNSQAGMWNKQANDWEVLPSSMNRHVRKAVKVAAKRIAPELLNLPISAPEGV
jgi:hypothetical protein